MQSNYLTNRVTVVRLNVANEAVDVYYPSIETALTLVKDGCLSSGKYRRYIAWNGSDWNGGALQQYSHIIQLKCQCDDPDGLPKLKRDMANDPLALAVFETEDYTLSVLVKHEVDQMWQCGDAINFLADYWQKKYQLAYGVEVCDEPKAFSTGSIDPFPSDTGIIVNPDSCAFRTPYAYAYSYQDDAPQAGPSSSIQLSSN